MGEEIGMTIEQARYIVEVAHQGTIQQAAKDLYVSQSAISQSVKLLEKDLGMQIFYRTRTGCELTSFGKEIYKLCLQIVTNIDAIEAFPLSRTNTKKGRVAVGMANYGLYAYIAQVAAMFHKTFPNVELVINELDYSQMIESIDSGAYDFGIAVTLENTYKELNEKYDCMLLAESYLTVGVSRHGELFNENALTPEQLIQKSWVLSNPSFAQSFWDILKQTNREVLFYSNNITLINSAISRDLAIGVFTDLMPYYNKLLFQDTIVTLPLIVEGRRPCSYFISMVPRNRAMSDTAQALLELWVKYAKFSPLSL